MKDPLLLLLGLGPVVIAWVAVSWRDWLYKPHVVRFEDGTYGVRRWDVYWEVLGRGGRSGVWYWWSQRYAKHWCTFATESEALAALAAWRKEQIPRADVGRKV